MYIKTETSETVLLKKWKNFCESLPKNVFIFTRKALIFGLPNMANLKRWSKSENDLCTLCGKKETHGGIIPYYTPCIYMFCSQLSQFGWKTYVDLNGFQSPNEFFTSLRPDMALVKGNRIVIVELTCCFDTNTVKSQTYKLNRYRNIEADVKMKEFLIRKVFVEVTSLGFITNNIKEYKRIFKNKNINVERMFNDRLNT